MAIPVQAALPVMPASAPLTQSLPPVSPEVTGMFTGVFVAACNNYPNTNKGGKTMGIGWEVAVSGWIRVSVLSLP